MSHITDVPMIVTDLDALAEAAAKCGAAMRLGQKTYEWYGKFMKDSVEGRRVAEQRGAETFGQCEHAIRVAGHAPGDYEVGVVKALDGKGYTLLFDTWGPGRKLVTAFGPDLNKLRREYSCAVAMAKAKKKLGPKGWTVKRIDQPNGHIRLKVGKR